MLNKQEFKKMAPMLRKVREHLGFTLEEAAELLESKLKDSSEE